MLIPRYTHAHRYLKITILCTSTCVYTHRYKNYTIYLHICKHILTYGRAGTVAGIPPITTSAGACTPCSRTLTPPSRSPPPPGCRCILPKGFIKTQRTEMGTHGVRRERGGVAYSCRQPPARGHHRGTVGVTALAGVPVPAPAVPSFHPCAPNPAHARTPPDLATGPLLGQHRAPRGSAGTRRCSPRGWAGGLRQRGWRQACTRSNTTRT